jgi:hypothetical protein
MLSSHLPFSQLIIGVLFGSLLLIGIIALMIFYWRHPEASQRKAQVIRVSPVGQGQGQGGPSSKIVQQPLRDQRRGLHDLNDLQSP